MPAKYAIKQYVVDGYYHIYNRGVEKRIIFLDSQDYTVFLRFLKEYLLPPGHPALLALQGINPRRHPINCYNDVSLRAYCLMPNHFHLFIKQLSPKGIFIFMKTLLTNYSMYFNIKYKRVGPLFQGIYKAILVENEAYFLHLSRYIHRNADEILTRDQPLRSYEYSSYRDYLGKRKTEWLHPEEILSIFRSSRSLFPTDILSYESFVESYTESEGDITLSDDMMHDSDA